MNGNLIPVQRSDKNGHLVTRWVKSDSTGSYAKTPMPKVQQANHSTELRSEMKAMLESAIFLGCYRDEQTNLIPEKQLILNLNDLSDDTIEMFRDAIKEHPSDCYPDLLLSVLQNKDQDARARSILAVAKIMEEKDGEWDDNFSLGGTYSYITANQALKGLSMYEWSSFTAPNDLTDETDPGHAQAIALVTVATRMWENEDIDDLIDNAVCVHDGNLVDLILERPESAEEIAETVHATKTTDGKRIREMMDNSSKSLRSGVL